MPFYIDFFLLLLFLFLLRPWCCVHICPEDVFDMNQFRYLYNSFVLLILLLLLLVVVVVVTVRCHFGSWALSVAMRNQSGQIPRWAKITLMRSNHKLKIERGKSRNFSHFSGCCCCCCCCLPAIRYLGLHRYFGFSIMQTFTWLLFAEGHSALPLPSLMSSLVVRFLAMPSFNRTMPHRAMLNHAETVIHTHSHTVTDVLLNFVHFDFIFGIICISVGAQSLSLSLFGGVSFCG